MANAPNRFSGVAASFGSSSDCWPSGPDSSDAGASVIASVPARGDRALGHTAISMGTEENANDLFWDCAHELYNLPEVREGTIFGFRCLRAGGNFVGMPVDDGLWVKLPESRVNELIDAGTGDLCRPNGRIFREWVTISELDESLWLGLLRESVDFVHPS